MIVYVGQCGQMYDGPTYPQHHGKECCLSAWHHRDHGVQEHMAFVWNDGQPDHIRFLTRFQKAYGVKIPPFPEIPTYMHYVVRPNLFSVGTVEGCY